MPPLSTEKKKQHRLYALSSAIETRYCYLLVCKGRKKRLAI